jgi:outer membrane protein assembly factor BamD
VIARILLVVSVAAFLMNCAGNKPKPDWTASQYYHYAKAKYDDGDYFEASNELTVVVLRYAGSPVADSAQYYLGMCHFSMDEYLIAASEFEKLINNMSRSPMVPNAQFKLAESYFKLSPRPSLDQKYTSKAIREYQIFIEDYPTNELKSEAEKRISQLREKMATKQYQNAEGYRKMREYRAAIIYFDIVLNEYYDSSKADDALIGKIRTYIEMEDYTSAEQSYIKFKEQFPQSELLPEAEDLYDSLPEKFTSTEQ